MGGRALPKRVVDCRACEFRYLSGIGSSWRVGELKEKGKPPMAAGTDVSRADLSVVPCLASAQNRTEQLSSRCRSSLASTAKPVIIPDC